MLGKALIYGLSFSCFLSCTGLFSISLVLDLEQQDDLVLILVSLIFLISLPSLSTFFYWLLKDEYKQQVNLSDTSQNVPQDVTVAQKNDVTLESIRELSPVEFEKFVSFYFGRMGYVVETTPLSGDGGVDLFLKSDVREAIVQCKRYKGTVGQPTLRDLYGAMMHHKADEAYIITTGTISLPAQKWAEGKPIHLVDGVTLMQWIEQF